MHCIFTLYAISASFIKSSDITCLFSSSRSFTLRRIKIQRKFQNNLSQVFDFRHLGALIPSLLIAFFVTTFLSCKAVHLSKGK